MGKSAAPVRHQARDRGRNPRTCVGCRQRAAATELLRITVAGRPGAEPFGDFRLVPDPKRRQPGRGAHVHLDRSCVEAAIRRRAFVRALRVRQMPDPAPLWEYITQQIG